MYLVGMIVGMVFWGTVAFAAFKRALSPDGPPNAAVIFEKILDSRPWLPWAGAVVGLGLSSMGIVWLRAMVSDYETGIAAPLMLGILGSVSIGISAAAATSDLG